jgi:AraC-like DNA-binding protein
VNALGPRDVSTSPLDAEVRQALPEALNEPSPPRLWDVAQRFGHTTYRRLLEVDRELCVKINDRRRQSSLHDNPTVKRDPALVRKALEDVLNSSETVSLNKISLRLGYSSSNIIQSTFLDLRAALIRKNKTDKLGRLERVRRGLEEALREEPAPTLQSVARRLGFSGSAGLRYYEPEMVNQVAERYQRSIRERGDLLIIKAGQIIAENPPPSLKELSRRLGIRKDMFFRLYPPEFRKRLSLRRREWISNESRRRKERLFAEVKEIAEELARKGFYPSVERIRELLSPGHTGRWGTISMAVREARDALKSCPNLGHVMGVSK